MRISMVSNFYAQTSFKGKFKFVNEDEYEDREQRTTIITRNYIYHPYKYETTEEIQKNLKEFNKKHKSYGADKIPDGGKNSETEESTYTQGYGYDILYSATLGSRLPFNKSAIDIED